MREPAGEPHRDDFATLADYERAWLTWRAQQRDKRLNPDEGEAKFDTQLRHLAAVSGEPYERLREHADNHGGAP